MTDKYIRVKQELDRKLLGKANCIGCIAESNDLLCGSLPPCKVNEIEYIYIKDNKTNGD